MSEQIGLQWSYSFRRTATEIFDEFINEPTVFGQNQSIFTTALVGDHRDSVVSPSRGIFWNVTGQAAPRVLGASNKFVKFFGQAYAFVSLGHGVVWASGYRVGVANDFGERVDEQDRFQAGGPSSVRGFEQGTLGPIDPIRQAPIGGSGVLIVNQEIRVPIVWRLRGVGFYDAGNAFAQPSDISLSGLRHSVGVGLRFELPFGLIRLDWARVLEPRDDDSLSRFVFTLGHAF